MTFLGCGEDVLMELVEGNDFIPILAIFMGCLVGMVAIVSGAITNSVKTRAREATKREIAAYVAEGSISPEDGVAMIHAGQPNWEAPDRKA